MAELVQNSLESMLQEFEQAERVGIFTKKEIKAILKKRKSFEYRLCRRVKSKEDYTQYIQYEINVLSLIKKRRSKIGYQFKQAEIDVSIVRRINRLFREATLHFKEDLSLWMTHIEFAKQSKSKSLVSKLFSSVLRIHNHRPELWIMAAKWELEEHRSVSNARQLMQRALRFLPRSNELWIQYYKMELIHVFRVRKRREVLELDQDEENQKVPDKVIQSGVAKVVFEKATEEFPDSPQIWLEFLQVAKEFEFTGDLQEAILTRTSERFATSELVWMARATHRLGNLEKLQEMIDAEPGSIFLELSQHCFPVLDEAVETVRTAKMVECCVELYERLLGYTKGTEFHREVLARCLVLFEKAESTGIVSADLYLAWARVLLHQRRKADEAKEVLQRATSQFPSEGALWVERIQLTANDSPELLQGLVQQAQSSVPSQETAALWKSAVDAAQPEGKLCILEAASRSTSEVVASWAKEALLRLVAESKGITDVRKTFRKFCRTGKCPLSVYEAYVDQEVALGSPDLRRCRAALEEALLHYANCTSLWLRYIRLEVSSGDPARLGELHWRATKALPADVLEQFSVLYSRETVAENHD